MGAFFLNSLFLNSLLLFRYLGCKPKWRKSNKRFRNGGIATCGRLREYPKDILGGDNGVTVTTVTPKRTALPFSTFVQKGFPQLSRKYTLTFLLEVSYAAFKDLLILVAANVLCDVNADTLRVTHLAQHSAVR